MTPEEARTAIYDRFKSGFTDKQSADDVTVIQDSEKATDPATDAWVRISVRHSGREGNTIGGQERLSAGVFRFRRTSKSTARVFLQLFTKIGQPPLDALALEAANVFDSISFSGMHFQPAITRELGPDGKWFVILIEIQFEYYDQTI